MADGSMYKNDMWALLRCVLAEVDGFQIKHRYEVERAMRLQSLGLVRVVMYPTNAARKREKHGIKKAIT